MYSADNDAQDENFREREAQEHCADCGQIDRGQTGEHPCATCGLPWIWDDEPCPQK